jgi:uncharacterized membrane protein YbhN (UPF0104 family)
VEASTRRTGSARRWLSVLVAVVVTAVLVAVILRRRDEFAAAVGSAPLWVLAVATGLQVVALLARTDAWHVCVRAAGGTLDRRPLYRAAGLGYLGSQLNSQVGTAARIAALRRAHPGESPRVPALIAAEVPIVVVEGAFGALASFTLVGPLGLPWWAPLVRLVVAAGLSVWLGGSRARRRRLAQRARRPAQPAGAQPGRRARDARRSPPRSCATGSCSARSGSTRRSPMPPRCSSPRRP